MSKMIVAIIYQTVMIFCVQASTILIRIIVHIKPVTVYLVDIIINNFHCHFISIISLSFRNALDLSRPFT